MQACTVIQMKEILTSSFQEIGFHAIVAYISFGRSVLDKSIHFSYWMNLQKSTPWILFYRQSMCAKIFICPKTVENFLKNYSLLNPLAGDLCVQLLRGNVRQRRCCLADFFPNLGFFKQIIFGKLIFLVLECYPLPKQQLFSFIRSTCHPWTFRDLKNLPMIVFFFHSTPNLLISP